MLLCVKGWILIFFVQCEKLNFTFVNCMRSYRASQSEIKATTILQFVFSDWITTISILKDHQSFQLHLVEVCSASKISSILYPVPRVSVCISFVCFGVFFLSQFCQVFAICQKKYLRSFAICTQQSERLNYESPARINHLIKQNNKKKNGERSKWAVNKEEIIIR